MLLLSFMKDQATDNDSKPKIINIFSFKEKFNTLLKKIKYTRIKEIINNGINFDVIKTTKYLYFFEMNKYLIPRYEFRERIEDICSG